MRKIILLFSIIIGLAMLSGCSKIGATETIVEIVVKDASGNKANWTVYQIEDTKFNMIGADPLFSDQQSVTDDNGLATFIIDNVDFTGGGQRTYYFFIQYSKGGINKSKNVGITLSEGDKKSGTLVID